MGNNHNAGTIKKDNLHNLNIITYDMKLLKWSQR